MSATVTEEGGDAGACDLDRPFGAPTFAPGLTTIMAPLLGGLRLSPDYRTGYFFANLQTNGTSNDDLYVVTRAQANLPFNGIAPLGGSGINTAAGELDPSVTGDGLTLVFSRVTPVSRVQQLYYATRPVSAGPFTYAGVLPGVNTGGTDKSPFFREDGQVLYFASAPDLNTPYDIFRAERRGVEFEAPQAVGPLNLATADEEAPVITPDERTIYFRSDRTGGGARGSGDVWTATRASTNEPFGSPVNVSEVNSPDDETPTFVSRDGCTLYLSIYAVDVADPYGISGEYVAQKPAR